MKKSKLSLCQAMTFAVLGSAILMGTAKADHRNGAGWLVGTWYLALDSTPFGVPPGYPLGGLVMFNGDGTYQLQDAGDFGQATFVGKRHSYQFGAWKRVGRGRIVGTALFLEAELTTGEVERWQKVTIELQRTRSWSTLEGTVNVSILECPNLLPLPTALSCPDPVKHAADFVPLPPENVAIKLRRIRAGR